MRSIGTRAHLSFRRSEMGRCDQSVLLRAVRFELADRILTVDGFSSDPYALLYLSLVSFVDCDMSLEFAAPREGHLLNPRRKAYQQSGL